VTRLVALVAGALAIGGAVVVAGTRAEPDAAPTTTVRDGRFTGHGVSFTYPAAWNAGPTRFLIESATPEWSWAFLPRDGPSGVSVSAYRLSFDVTDLAPRELRARTGDLVRQMAELSGGRLTRDLVPTEVGGVRGFHARFKVMIDGRGFRERITMLFAGDRQWNIQCQYRERTRILIGVGCRAVRDSFRVDDP
jgi:hypothetical protein